MGVRPTELHKYPGGFHDFSGGLNDTDNPTDLKNNELLICTNWKLHKDGKSLIKRPGYSEDSGAAQNFGDPVRGITQFKDYLGNVRRVVVTDKKIFVEAVGGGSWIEIYSQASAVGFPMRPVTFESGRPIITGFDKNLYIFSGYQGGVILDAFQLGVDPPASGLSAAAGAAGNITGDYEYLVTFSTSGTNETTQIFPYESKPSLESEDIAGEKVTDGGLEAWDSDTDLTNWIENITGSSTIHKDSSVKHGGSFSARLDIDGSNSDAWIQGALTLTKGQKYRLRVWYQMSASGTGRIQLNDVGQNVFLKSDGSWGTAGHISLPYSASLTHIDIDFEGHRNYSSYKIYLANETSPSISIWFDDISVRPIQAVTLSAQKANLTNIPVSPDPQVRRRRIWRTKNGGAIFYWLDDIADNTTTEYEDNWTDADIQENDLLSYSRGVPPVGEDVEVWDNKVWILVPEEGKVYYANSGEEAEMYAGNFLQIEARETEEPIAIKAYGDYLYVFKPHRNFRIKKLGEYYYEVVPTDLPGCVARGSVIVARKLLMWKSERGIEMLRGEDLLEPEISRKIQNTLATINPSYLSKICAAYHELDNEYWLSVPTGSATEPDKVIVVNIFDFGDKMTAFFNGIDSSDNYSFLCGSGSSSAGYLFRYKEGVQSDGGMSILATVRTKQIPVSEEKEIWNILRRMFVAYQYYPATSYFYMNIYSSLESTPVVFEHKLYGSDVTDEKIKEIIRKINLGINAPIISVEFKSAGIEAAEVRLLGFDLYFDKKTWKKDIYGV
jgi:hypothetical protein